MKVNELQIGHYYACYDTWRKEVDTTTVNIIKVSNKERTEYGFRKVWGEITECSLPEFSIEFTYIKAYPETDFKEITEKQYAEILNKYKALYSAAQKLME